MIATIIIIVVTALSLYGTAKLLDHLDLTDSKHAAKKDSYKIIKKSNGKYYATRRVKNLPFRTSERELYGTTLKEAIVSLDRRVDIAKETLIEETSTLEGVWEGKDLKTK